MGTRHPNFRLVKVHRTYSIEELARLFTIHKNTVRAWQKAGLTPIDDSRPILFKGGMVVAFLRERRNAAKQPCGVGHIFCLPCRAPKAPAGGMAEYLPITPTSGNLRALCPDCGRLMHRRMRLDKIGVLAAGLDVSHTHALPRIREAPALSVNCDDGGAALAGPFPAAPRSLPHSHQPSVLPISPSQRIHTHAQTECTE
jgi:hypothetical protein